MHITSRSNEFLKHVRAVRDGRNRQAIFLEGVRLCEEALRSALAIEAVIHTTDAPRHEREQVLLAELSRQARRVYSVPPDVFATLSDVEVHQGLCLLATPPSTGAQYLRLSAAAPLLLVLHKLNNPSNAGALLRTAEAAGANGVIATGGTTYLFSPKALRGAMGASLRLPLWTGPTLPEVANWCTEHGIYTVCADVRATLRHTEIDWTRPTALVMGPEASGLTAAEREMMQQLLRIPMQTPVESLNVGVAAGIALYEAARQRGFANTAAVAANSQSSTA